jgi:hypothetical protein
MLKHYAQSIYKKTPLYAWQLGKNIHFHQRIPFADMWPGDSEKAKKIAQGFVYDKQNQPSLLSDALDEESDYNNAYFHQFHWLRDLKTLGDDTARRMAREIIMRWHQTHKRWDEDPWNNLNTAYRLFHLVTSYDFYGSSAPSSFKQTLHPLFEKQAHHLVRSVDLQEQSFENLFFIKVLFFIRFYFDNTGLCEQKLLKDYEILLKKQILKDGFHISRKSSYQLLLLRDLIEVRALLAKHGYRFPLFFKKLMETITPTVRFLRHSDGGLSHFGGSRLHIHRSMVDAVLSFSNIKGAIPNNFPYGRFQRLQVKHSTLLLNYGTFVNAKDANQWDSVNFEWSVGSHRVIQNSCYYFFHQEKFLKPSSKRPVSDCSLVSEKQHTLLSAHQDDHPHGIFLKRHIYITPSAKDLRVEDVFLSEKKDITAWIFLSIGEEYIIDAHTSKHILLMDKDGVPCWRLVTSKNIDILQDPSTPNQLALQIIAHKSVPFTAQWGWSSVQS